MKYLFKGVTLAVVLTLAGPVWSRTADGSEKINAPNMDQLPIDRVYVAR